MRDHQGERKGNPMAQIAVNKEQIREFCRKNHIRWMALFGSVLREDFSPESDIDVLVEFDPAHVPGFLGLACLARELKALFGGLSVDVRTPRDLSRYFREEVLRRAQVIYAEE
jgi:predicted nucleotidyltransferase